MRIVLAMLLIAEGGVVSIARLVDAVWGETPPATAEKQIRNSVSELRKKLCGTGAGVQTVRPGYRIVAPWGSTDVSEFRTRILQAQASADSGQMHAAIRQFRLALALWRGTPLADVDSGLVSALVMPLNEEWLAAYEDCIRIELTEGSQRRAVPELLGLVTHHPHREGLVECLMQALYESGERSRALAAYERLRRTLEHELGAPPSAGLQELNARIRSDERAGLSA